MPTTVGRCRGSARARDRRVSRFTHEWVLAGRTVMPEFRRQEHGMNKPTPVHPGWYPVGDSERYWNGSAWSAYVRAPQSSPNPWTAKDSYGFPHQPESPSAQPAQAPPPVWPVGPGSPPDECAGLAAGTRVWA